MDWQIGNVWSCPAADFRWVAVSCGEAHGAQYTQSARQFPLLLHMDPPKSGSDPDLARLGLIQTRIWPDQAGPNQLEAILALVWVRFRFVFRPLGLCKCKCKCNCKGKCKCNSNANLIRATGGMSIDR